MQSLLIWCSHLKRRLIWDPNFWESVLVIFSSIAIIAVAGEIALLVITVYNLRFNVNPEVAHINPNAANWDAVLVFDVNPRSSAIVALSVRNLAHRYTSHAVKLTKAPPIDSLWQLVYLHCLPWVHCSSRHLACEECFGDEQSRRYPVIRSLWMTWYNSTICDVRVHGNRFTASKQSMIFDDDNINSTCISFTECIKYVSCTCSKFKQGAPPCRQIVMSYE